jgi:hypothetical protein
VRFIDLNDNSVTTLSEIRRDWADSRADDPENTAPDFLTEIFEILMATVNGRNDLEIVGPTPREVNRLILKLRARLLN